MSREREQFWPGAGPGGGRDCSYSGETGRLVPSSQSSDLIKARRLSAGGVGGELEVAPSASRCRAQGCWNWKVP